ncbi:MAG: HlyD family efflux transporter periplasmic adaptor subunit [Chloroflexota bacterium]
MAALLSQGGRRAFGAVAVLALLGAGTVAVGRAGLLPLPARLGVAQPSVAAAHYVPTFVKKGTITVKVKADGAVVTPPQVSVTAPVGSTLSALHVLPGQQVRAGQAIGALDTTALAGAISQAKLALAQAQATVAADQSSLGALSAGPRPELVTQAQATLTKARATLAADEARLQAVKAGPSALSVAQAQGATTGAQSALADAQAKLRAAQQAAPLLMAQAQTAVRKARNDLFAAQTSRDGICGQSKGYKCQAANAQVGTATEGLTAAQTSLAQQSGTNAATIASAQAAVDQAAAALQQSQAALAVAKAPPASDVIAAAASAVSRDRASIAFEQAALSLALRPGSPTALAQAQAALSRDQAAVAQAQSGLNIAETRLKSAILTSPVAGVVMTVSGVVGSYVPGGTALVTVAPVDVTAVTANVSEFDVRKLKLHDAATVKVDSFPGKKLRGSVTLLGMLPVTVQGVVFYPVTITVQNPKHLTLRPGMTLRATIVAETKKNVMVLPNNVIGQKNGSEAVLVPVAGAAPAWKSIQAGITDGKFTEVQSGLKLGQQVLLKSSAGSLPSSSAASSAPGKAKASSAPPGIGVPSSNQGGQH